LAEAVGVQARVETESEESESGPKESEPRVHPVAGGVGAEAAAVAAVAAAAPPVAKKLPGAAV
jgi:hypothetical protein